MFLALVILVLGLVLCTAFAGLIIRIATPRLESEMARMRRLRP